MSNLNTEQINQTRSFLEEAKSISILVGGNPTIDSLAAALSLYLSLSANGKMASIACSTPMTVEYNRLVGVDKVANSINGQSGRNLIISFPYQEGSIEKVSYNIENDTFNLVIEPREGFTVITPEMMQYSFSGGSTDVIATIGVTKLEDLDNLYTNNQALFSEKPVINIDNSTQNSRFGKINLIDSTFSSNSELVLTLLSNFGLTLESDIATNLLTGIIEETDNFTSPSTSASTFEAAAICLKNNARKEKPEESSPVQMPQFVRPTTQSPLSRKQSIPSSKPVMPFGKSPTPFGKQPPTFQVPTTKQKTPPAKQPQSTPPLHESTHPETPPDWLKPKIYKGSTLL